MYFNMNKFIQIRTYRNRIMIMRCGKSLEKPFYKGALTAVYTILKFNLTKNMSETLHTNHEDAERTELKDRQPLTQEIIEKLLRLFDELGDIVKYCDVVTSEGDSRRITRHPTSKFLLRISSPNRTKDLDPSDPDIYRELFIFNEVVAEILKDATDIGIARIKEKARQYNALPYFVRAQIHPDVY